MRAQALRDSTVLQEQLRAAQRDIETLSMELGARDRTVKSAERACVARLLLLQITLIFMRQEIENKLRLEIQADAEQRIASETQRRVESESARAQLAADLATAQAQCNDVCNRSRV